MLLRDETIDPTTVLALVLLQVFLRLRHLVAVRFLLSFESRPRRLLILLF